MNGCLEVLDVEESSGIRDELLDDAVFTASDGLCRKEKDDADTRSHR